MSNVIIRDWTFTHWWVRPVVKVWFDIYHKSVTYSGTEHVDWSKPIIFAPSHQNAFSDALCLILPTQYTNDRFIYPLIRADAFGNHKVVDWILTAFHMLPVYRPKDNVDIKQRNDSVFEDCHNLLSRNRNLLIHPEGNCFPVKHVRRFKKGLARIALDTEDRHDFNLGLTVIPVGINYREITNARKGIHVQYGSPILVSKFQASYREHSASAITALTKKVENGVKEVTVDIPKEEHYQTIEQLLRLAKAQNNNFASSSAYTRDEVKFEKKLIDELKISARKTPSFWEKIKGLIKKIYSTLSDYKLDPGKALTRPPSQSGLILQGFVFLALLPIFLFGWIHSILPWFLCHKSVGNIKDGQFISSIRMLAGLLLFPVNYLILGGIFWWVSGSWGWTLLYILSISLSGILSLNLWERWKEWKQRLRLSMLSQPEKEKLSSLMDDLFSTIGADRAKESLSDST